MRRKLRQKKGETLIEALVSLLIVLLSVGMISTCLLTATNINMQTKEADETYNQQLQHAEGLIEEEGYEAEEVEVQIKFQSGDNKTVKVKLYGGKESSFAAYDYGIEVSEP